MRKIILLLASLLWLGYWWWWYICKICPDCGCNRTEVQSIPPAEKESGVLLFNFNDSSAMIQPAWPDFRDSLMSSLHSNQSIEIEGQYLAEEPNTSSFSNMGLARAHAIKLLFPDSLRNRIQLTSLQVAKRSTMAFPFAASAISVKNISEKVEQSGDKTLIYFKYNSDQRIHDAEIEKYLTTLAEQHKGLNSTFIITGHTDNTGNEAFNLRLGLQRANAIKNYLVSKGIASDRITTKSMGESAPVETNNTPGGRQKNRRTEIEIIQKQ